MIWTGSSTGYDKDALEVAILSKDALTVLDTCDHFTSSLNKIVSRVKEMPLLNQTEKEALLHISTPAHRQVFLLRPTNHGKDS